MRFVNPRPYIMTDRTASTTRLRSFNRESFLADRPITDTKEKSFFVRIALHRGELFALRSSCSYRVPFSPIPSPPPLPLFVLLCAPSKSEIGGSRCMIYARRTRNQRRPSSLTSISTEKLVRDGRATVLRIHYSKWFAEKRKIAPEERNKAM